MIRQAEVRVRLEAESCKCQKGGRESFSCARNGKGSGTRDLRDPRAVLGMFGERRGVEADAYQVKRREGAFALDRSRHQRSLLGL